MISLSCWEEGCEEEEEVADSHLAKWSQLNLK